MKRTLGPASIIYAVRIAANEAAARRNSMQGNPVYAKALDIVATALEQAGISSCRDGDYYMVKLPDKVTVTDEEGAA